MIKKLLLGIGVLTLITLCIKFQFDKLQLTKQLRASNETVENFKLTVSAYQDFIRELTTRVSRDCPEILKGPSHPPLLKAPSSDSGTDEFPESIKPTPPSPNQEYLINGMTPQI